MTMKRVMDHLSVFAQRGCTVVPRAVATGQLEAAERFCDALVLSGAGSRNLLSQSWCTEMARSLREHETIRVLLQDSLTAVQCTLFVKDARRNWLVPLHRDLGVPLRERVEAPDWSGWSIKQGVLYGQPPDCVSRALVAVRVHLEDTGAENGALQVVAGSHLHYAGSGVRRVLHFLYGPARLPDGAEWAHAV